MSRRNGWRRRLSRKIHEVDPFGVIRRRTAYAVGGLLIFGLIWILATALLVKRQQNQIEVALRNVQNQVAAGDIAGAQNAAKNIPTMVRRAHLLTSGPAWWTAAELPYVGTPFEIARGATSASLTVGADVLPKLLNVASSLDPAKLRVGGHTVDLQPLVDAEPTLSTAARQLDKALASLSAVPLDGWLTPINNTRIQLELQMRAVGGYVDAASRAAKVLPNMLGLHGTKRYFIALQNEAEARGTGGLPGAFAIATATKGTVKFRTFSSDFALLPVANKQRIPTGLDFGQNYHAAYGSMTPTSFFTNGNVSPHFPYAARVWAAMWQKHSGQHIDGVVAIDPQVLAYFLGATGPVAMPDGSVIGANNVVELTEKDQYQIFTDNFARKDYLVSILKSVSTNLMSGRASAMRLAKAATAAAKEQRFLVWSADPSVESVLAETDYAGAIPDNSRPFVGLVLNNASAGKLDYYVTRSLTYHRSGCGSQRDVLVTIQLRNNAPASGLPIYVTTRLDHPPYPTKPGDSRTILDYYATQGAQLQSATLNDKPTTIIVQQDRGHPIFRMDLELPRGKTQTLTLHLSEPAGKGQPRVWRQPGVSPMGVVFYSQACH